ncbi:methylglyoxal synthase [Aestuariirhabdus sp. LZHN29]|uniref:methylglyoxal synthase n=1 Tax=Aestuariirhabdus sp. LZHN29 TaxID=3417462 RepID=UPI003CEE8846
MQLQYQQRSVAATKTIALVAHDHQKEALMEWCANQHQRLSRHRLLATETTANMLIDRHQLRVRPLLSGPMGGDQQLGALIAEGEVDVLVFFWDPLEQQPHDPDIKALLRIAAVWNLPIACNRASADFLFSSPLIDNSHYRLSPDYPSYRAQRHNPPSHPEEY